MTKIPVSIYIDNNVLSAYTDDAIRTEQTLEAADLWLECLAYKVRMLTSSVTTEEAFQGNDQRQKHRRAVALRFLKPVFEPSANRNDALELLDRCSDRKHASRLFNDARHFLMAVRLGCSYLITYNDRDFHTLVRAYDGPYPVPSIMRPGAFVNRLRRGPLPKVRTNPPRPTRYAPLRGRIKEIVAKNKRVQIRLAKAWFKKMGV